MWRARLNISSCTLSRIRWIGLEMAALVLVLSIACSPQSVHTSARELLDAEVDILPFPTDSQVLAQNDRIGGGQIPECAGVVTEILIGNSKPVEEIYEFYDKELSQLDWTIRSQDEHGVALSKGERIGIEISDNYYLSTVADSNRIREWEKEFRSLSYIKIGYSFYDQAKCQKALNRIGNKQ